MSFPDSPYPKPQVVMSESSHHDARHREIWELIPWVVIGRASDVERDAVEAHGLQCPDCADELNFQRNLQHAMAEEDGPEFDSERGWQRMQRALDIRSDDIGADATDVSDAAPRPALRLRQVFAIMAIEAIVLSFAGAALLHGGGQTDRHYLTLATPTQAPRIATIRLVVSPDLTVAQLETLLRSLKMQIVEGPTESGAFALAPIDPGSDVSAIVNRLRATSGVRLAEPIR